MHSWEVVWEQALQVLSSQPTPVPSLEPLRQLEVDYKNKKTPNSRGLSIHRRRHSPWVA